MKFGRIIAVALSFAALVLQTGCVTIVRPQPTPAIAYRSSSELQKQSEKVAPATKRFAANVTAGSQQTSSAGTVRHPRLVARKSRSLLAKAKSSLGISRPELNSAAIASTKPPATTARANSIASLDDENDRSQTVAYVQDDRPATHPACPVAINPAHVSQGRIQLGIESDVQTIGETQDQLESNTESFPIDLATALQLAGADNWQVKLARERACEARARVLAADALWLPDFHFGIGYNRHEGRLQATEGNIADVSRGSLFVGGGSVSGNNNIAGGAGGPVLFGATLSLADVYFEPLAARQLVCAANQETDKVLNTIQLQAAIAYYDLVEAQSELAIEQQNHREAIEIRDTIQSFVDAGKGTQSDVSRSQVIVATRQQQVARVRASIGVAAARLAQILQLDPEKLDPESGLMAADELPTAVEMVDPDVALNELIAQAHALRPEILEQNSRLRATQFQVAQENWRPRIPNLQLGTSYGNFGGGQGSNFPDFDTRSDIDVMLSWQFRNLGVGDRAAQQIRSSQFRQACLAAGHIRDQVTTEVVSAYKQLIAYRDAMRLAELNIQLAKASVETDRDRIRDLEGSPLEAIQSLDALAKSRLAYLRTITQYNQAQMSLVYAIGQPIGQ